MFGTPVDIETKVWTRLPKRYRRDSSVGSNVQQPGKRIHSFLEGPSFDREGNFYCVDIPFGRIFRVTPRGEWSLVVEYSGEPNGLKIHKDGRIFVADRINGIMVLAPGSDEVEPFLTRVNMEPLLGPNDLVFSSAGDLYFTDPGWSSLNNPNGRVFRVTPKREVRLLASNVPYPNGLVLNLAENNLYVAVSKENSIWRIVESDLSASTNGRDSAWTLSRLFIQLSGGLGGPDGMAIDDEDNLFIAHHGFGTVWGFNRYGEIIYRIRSCEGRSVTNIAFGGPNRTTLYITETESGAILTAEMKVPGRMMFSHM